MISLLTSWGRCLPLRFSLRQRPEGGVCLRCRRI